MNKLELENNKLKNLLGNASIFLLQYAELLDQQCLNLTASEKTRLDAVKSLYESIQNYCN